MHKAHKLILAVLLFWIAVMSCGPALANDKDDAVQLVDKAKFSVESFMADEQMAVFHDVLKKAKGVFIAPQLLKGAFIIGASGGSGVLLVRDEKTGKWNGPAFYTIGGLSYGLQIGGQASELMLLIMTDRGIKSLQSNSLKLGADIGLAAGPVGGGASASTANLSADILSFSRSKGFYGGISVDGAVVAVRTDWNDAFYGKAVTPADILAYRHAAQNPHAAGLATAISKAAAHK